MADQNTIFLTGGSGFVGQAVAKMLVERGYGVRALVHRQSPGTFAGVQCCEGDLFAPGSLEPAMRGCAAVIHLVGIINEVPRRGITFEHLHVDATRSVLTAAQRSGVRRFIHMSVLGARRDAASHYHRSKWQAEQLVQTSQLDWTIFRPSLIHGPHGQFTRMMNAWAKKRQAPWLFMPYFGRGWLGMAGSGTIQPIFVDEVARAFADSLHISATIGRAYDLAGKDILTWPQMYHTAGRILVGKQRATAALPIWLARILASVLPYRLLGFNRDQVIMAGENNTADSNAFINDFGWCPSGFASTLTSYADSIDGGTF